MPEKQAGHAGVTPETGASLQCQNAAVAYVPVGLSYELGSIEIPRSERSAGCILRMGDIAEFQNDTGIFIEGHPNILVNGKPLVSAAHHAIGSKGTVGRPQKLTASVLVGPGCTSLALEESKEPDPASKSLPPSTVDESPKPSKAVPQKKEYEALTVSAQYGFGPYAVSGGDMYLRDPQTGKTYKYSFFGHGPALSMGPALEEKCSMVTLSKPDVLDGKRCYSVGGSAGLGAGITADLTYGGGECNGLGTSGGAAAEFGAGIAGQETHYKFHGEAEPPPNICLGDGGAK